MPLNGGWWSRTIIFWLSRALPVMFCPDPKSENIVSSWVSSMSSKTSKLTNSMSCSLFCLSSMVDNIAPEQIPSQSMWE